MKTLSAYLLLVLGGKENPTAEDVKGLLTKLDVEVDGEKVDQLIKGLEGKSIDEVLAEGEKKLLAVGGGGGGGAAAAAPAAGGAAAAAPAGGDKKEKKEEKPKEEEVDVGGATDLFAGGGGKY